MKKNRLYKFLNIVLISIIMIILVLFGKNIYNAIAITESVGGISNITYFRDLAHLGYSTVIGYDNSVIFDTECSDPDENQNQGHWRDCGQVVCIHSANTNDDYKKGKPYIIISLNPSGTDPKGGTLYYKDNGGTIHSYDLGQSDLNAQMAYFAAKAQINSPASSETKSGPGQHGLAWEDPKGFASLAVAQLIHEGGYRDYVYGKTNNTVTLPYVKEGEFSFAVLDNNSDIKAKAENYAAGCTTSDKTYSGLLLIFTGSAKESRALALGKMNNIEQPKVNKSISKIEVPTSYIKETNWNNTVTKDEVAGYQTAASLTRSSLQELEKYNSPVQVSPCTYVTYTIKAETNIAGSKELIDEFDSSVFEFVADKSTSGFTKVTDGKYKITANFEADKEKTFTVVLKVKKSAAETSLSENKATFKTVTSSDYIKITKTDNTAYTNAKGTYKKYITEVKDSNGNVKYSNATERKDYDNTTAKNNPVTVEKGDKVKFVIEITNTSSVPITEMKFTDTLEDGLKYTDSNPQSFTDSFGTIGANKTETKEYTVTVTKSNMYLLPIENAFVVSEGKYYRRKTITYTYTIQSGLGLSNPEFKYITYSSKAVQLNWFTSNNNKDYVQLDDVEIAGDVWEDKNKDGIKSGESALSGIKVYLYKNGTLVDTKITNSNGHYTFGRVKKGNKDFSGGTRKYTDDSGYNNYYVVFDYNGVTYESTVFTDLTDVTDSGPTNNWNNKSHACEDATSRTNFNKKFETIAYNAAYKGKQPSATSYDLSYSKNGNTSTLDLNDTTKMTSKSVDLYKYSKSTKNFTNIIKDSTYLKHINLGLKRRDVADLKTTKDVVKADVTVNGFKTTYEYETLDSNKALYKIDQPYKLRIYKEDYEFRTSKFGTVLGDIKKKENPYQNIYIPEESRNDLDITLTYKITVTNDSTEDKYVVVREILDYSSNEMTFRYARLNNRTLKGYTIDDLNKETNTVIYNKNFDNYNYSGYNTIFIRDGELDNHVLAKGESIDIYLTYGVNKLNNGYIQKDNINNDLGKVNIAEVAAFSIYNDKAKTTPSGLVDRDSNPANMNKEIMKNGLTEYGLYEDDTFQTSILTILKSDDITNPNNPNSGAYRQIKGNVWEDLNKDAISQTGQKVGDGIKSSENGVGAGKVRVKLMEVVKKSATGEEYLVDTGIETTTDENGNYILSDKNRLHAGQYVVRFIYGSEAGQLETTNNGDTIKYSGQDYKSTLYTEVGNNDENQVLEADAFSNKAGNKTYSFAKDNELRRLEVINYSTQMTYPLDNVLKAEKTNEQTNPKYGTMEKLAENTAMYADTKKFNTQIEYIDNYEQYGNWLEKTINGTKVYKYIINDIDFGLIERPKTKLTLMNDITEIIAQTSDGNELIHLYFDIEYTKPANSTEVKHEAKLNTVKSIGQENVQVLNRTYYSSQGFRYVNIDSELLQGMTITLKFQIAIANNSEVDTSNQNLIDMVKKNELSGVIDYLKDNTKSKGAQVYRYDVNSNSELSTLEKQMISSYSYNDLNSAINSMGTTRYLDYKTTSDYKLGYFLGKTYYTGKYSNNTNKVETRVDQIIDYVDTDLVFDLAINSNYVSYSIQEIADKQLLKGINGDSTISDGKSYYVVGNPGDGNYKNNLAFSIESPEINKGLYKYLKPLKSGNDLNVRDENNNLNNLYAINLEASRTLTSEADLKGVSIDNIAEIIKVTNTIGRKVYVKTEDINTAGHIGNSTGKISQINGSSGYNVMAGVTEVDTDFTEYTTFSPPTGLSQNIIKTNKVIDITIVIISSIIIILGSGYVGVKFATRKKFYK